MFASRVEAGRLLGEKLLGFALEKPVVLGITRGGVVVAVQVAKALKAPLYPLVVKKIGVPGNPEFSLGAMGPEGRIVGEIRELREIGEGVIEVLRSEVERRVRDYGVVNLGAKIKNKRVILVDDGVATGWTLRAALRYAQGKQPRKIVIAVPVADKGVADEIRKIVDELVVLEEVEGLGAVGNFYLDFAQMSDVAVDKILKR